MADSVFSALPAQTQSVLAQLSAAVEGVQPTTVTSWKIEPTVLLGETAATSLLQEVSDWAGTGQACLYYLECRSAGIDLGAVEHAFVKAKARKAPTRAYPRLNARGTCLYVGCSRSLAKRLTEHLGYGTKSTYALQLAHWAIPLSLQLGFSCAKYAEETPPGVMQALEDTLWGIRRPMFGRRGAK